MQNRFVCDLADFGKYGLLRYLTRPDPKVDKPDCDMKLGMVWYFRHDERHGNDPNKVSRDGSNIGYLRTTKENRMIYGCCDLPLWEKLGYLLMKEKRCIHCVGKSRIFPDSTKYFGTMLYFPPHMREGRAEFRTGWLNAALTRVKDTNIVCLDPDTGIGPEDERHSGQGPKYAYPSDIRGFFERKKSVVIYQHRTHEKEKAFIEGKKTALRGVCDAEPVILRMGTRYFFILPQPYHRIRINARVRRMVGDKLGWGRHFDLVKRNSDE